MTAIVLRALVEASIRATILAAIVAAILALLRVRASDVRHSAWTLVVGAMLALPLSPWLPLPALAIPAVSVPGGFDSVGHLAERLGLDPDRLLQPFPPLQPFQSLGPVRPVQAVQPSQPLQPAQPFQPSQPFLPMIAVYLVGAIAAAARCGLGWRAAARLTHRARIVPRDELPAECLDAPRGIVIRESPAIVTPVTIGIVSPTILLPAGWRRYSGDTRRAALAHEVAHVARRDPLVLLVARVNRCVFWFHPLAWWLTRVIAAEAEHAADAIAVRAIGEPRRYAAVLLEMARAVHDGGGRLARQTVGIGGSPLERRIERLLDSRPPAEASRARRRLVAGTCGLAIAVTAACRPGAVGDRFEASAAIQQRDRALRATLRSIDAQDYRDFRRAHWDQVGPRIASLEAAVARDPDDLSALRDLLVGYWVEPVVDRRRALILRLVERHPDAELAGSIQARLFPHEVDTALPADPSGYARAKTLWLAHVDRAGASAAVVGNAASFFETADPSLAETLLRRAQARDPHGPWSARLGTLYARVLTGIHAPASTNRLRVLTVAAPRSPYGVLVRKLLGESTDDILLTAAGWSLARGARGPSLEFDPDFWAESCLKRALQINPHAVLAHTELVRLRRDRDSARGQPLWAAPPALQYQTVSALPEAERFARLPRLARQSLVALDDLSRWDDPNLEERRDLARRDARRYAEDALALAPRYRHDPDYGTAIYTANMTLGALALRQGDTRAAVRCLLRAADAPASEALAYADDVVSGVRWHLAAELLERGEREAVARFLTRMAETNLARRTELRDAAAAIRRGETPRI